jgi:hypothetical protein
MSRERMSPIEGPPRQRRISEEEPPSSEMGSTNAEDEGEKTLQIEFPEVQRDHSASEVESDGKPAEPGRKSQSYSPPVPPERQHTEMSWTSLSDQSTGAVGTAQESDGELARVPQLL